MDAKFINLRLDVIDAALESIIKRQTIMARMNAGRRNPSDGLVQMSEALDGYIEAIDEMERRYENLKKEYENGSNN